MQFVLKKSLILILSTRLASIIFFYIIDELADWQLGLGYLDNSYYRPSKIYSLSERVSQALKACVQT